MKSTTSPPPAISVTTREAATRALPAEAAQVTTTLLSLYDTTSLDTIRAKAEPGSVVAFELEYLSDLREAFVELDCGHEEHFDALVESRMETLRRLRGDLS